MWNASEFVLCVLHNTINSIATAVVIQNGDNDGSGAAKVAQKIKSRQDSEITSICKRRYDELLLQRSKDESFSWQMNKILRSLPNYFVSHIFDCIVIFSLFGIWSKRLICTRNLAEYHFIMLQAIMKLYKIPSYANRWRRVTLWVSQNSSFSLYDWVIESLIQTDS